MITSFALVYAENKVKGLIEVDIGKPFSLDLKKFGKVTLLVKRETKAHKKPQYLFVVQNGFKWTTDGVR